MKYCIVYSTKSGSAKRCAALLAANLGIDNCDLYDIKDGIPDLSAYDFLIAGSYIRMAKINKKIIKLINKNEDSIPFALFFCGMIESGFAKILTKNFSEETINKSICTDFFGSDYKPENYHGIEKFVMDVLIKAAEDDENFHIVKNIFADRITAFANEIKELQS